MTDDDMYRRSAARVLADAQKTIDADAFVDDDDAELVLDRKAVAARLLELLPPADDGEPVTAEWLLAVGGEQLEDTVKPHGDPSNPNHRFLKVRLGPFNWFTNLWSSDGEGRYAATYLLKYNGACLGSSPDLTRNQFRHLCAALGITLTEPQS